MIASTNKLKLKVRKIFVKYAIDSKKMDFNVSSSVDSYVENAKNKKSNEKKKMKKKMEHKGRDFKTIRNLKKLLKRELRSLKVNLKCNLHKKHKPNKEEKEKLEKFLYINININVIVPNINLNILYFSISIYILFFFS